MEKRSGGSLNTNRLFKLAAVVACLSVFVYLGSGRAYSVAAPVEPAIADNPAKAKAAFTAASKVFFSPRCANCHAPGDTPTQGDAMKPHDPEIARGPDGKGVEELSCNACHQDTNTDGEAMPPGVPDWHMPPADHKMPFQGISVGELCKRLKDPAQNGGRKTPKDSIKHMQSDAIVLWAWSPGSGRTTPAMTHADFMNKLNEWAANGAACP